MGNEQLAAIKRDLRFLKLSGLARTYMQFLKVQFLFGSVRDIFTSFHFEQPANKNNVTLFAKSCFKEPKSGTLLKLQLQNISVSCRENLGNLSIQITDKAHSDFSAFLWQSRFRISNSTNDNFLFILRNHAKQICFLVSQQLCAKSQCSVVGSQNFTSHKAKHSCPLCPKDSRKYERTQFCYNGAFVYKLQMGFHQPYF